MAAVRHLEFSKLGIFNMWPVSNVIVTAESLRSVIVCVAAAAYCVDSVSGSVALAIEQSPEATVGR